MSATNDALTESGDDLDWIQWFCALKGNEFFVNVETNFIADAFNLTGLSTQVEHYDLAIDIILDEDLEAGVPADQQDAVESAAENLYGLIHARYILTSRGLTAMYDKYKNGDFGRCTRVYCRGAPMLPVGISDTTQQDCVKLYCPRCDEVYSPRSARHQHIDGAYFGTTFPHLFFLTFPELKPSAESRQVYEPRVYGFKLNKRAYELALEAKEAADAETNAANAAAQQQQQQQQQQAAALAQQQAAAAGQR